jgi:hypothetical protein
VGAKPNQLDPTAPLFFFGGSQIRQLLPRIPLLRAEHLSNIVKGRSPADWLVCERDRQALVVAVMYHLSQLDQESGAFQTKLRSLLASLDALLPPSLVGSSIMLLGPLVARIGSTSLYDHVMDCLHQDIQAREERLQQERQAQDAAKDATKTRAKQQQQNMQDQQQDQQEEDKEARITERKQRSKESAVEDESDTELKQEGERLLQDRKTGFRDQVVQLSLTFCNIALYRHASASDDASKPLPTSYMHRLPHAGSPTGVQASSPAPTAVAVSAAACLSPVPSSSSSSSSFSSSSSSSSLPSAAASSTAAFEIAWRPYVSREQLGSLLQVLVSDKGRLRFICEADAIHSWVVCYPSIVKSQLFRKFVETFPDIQLLPFLFPLFCQGGGAAGM